MREKQENEDTQRQEQDMLSEKSEVLEETANAKKTPRDKKQQ